MLLERLHQFWSHRSGNVAMLFAFASIPLIGFTGAAVDYGFATRLRTKLQASADASALMLCQTPSATTSAVLNLQAQSSMASYMGSGVGLAVDPLVITSSPRKITLTASATSSVVFGKFLGQTSIPVGAKAQCATPMPKTFEIALVLDTTGSMANSGGSGSKLSAAQTAANNFIDYVKGNDAFASDTRISIVPFAASVNAGTSYASASWVDTQGKSSYHWTNVDKNQVKSANFTSRFDIFSALSKKYSAWAWAGCFEGLPYPYNTQDGAPVAGNDDTLYIPMFAPDEPGNGTTSTAYFPNTRSGSASYNSYIDDSTSASNCNSTPSTFQAAENRACKYVSASGASYSTSAAVGLPNGPNFMCTSKPLQRLTTNTTTLKTLVSSLTAVGSTNIHEGFMWGWRTLSPKSVFADGASYDSTTTNKVIILMTDGANSWNDMSNYNKSLYFPMGYFVNADGSTPINRLPSGYQNLSNSTDARNALDQLTLQTCQNAQTTGISIYTIGFSVSSDPIDTQGKTLLANCASSPDQAYVANNSSDLIAAFDRIAKSIGALRLSQ